MTRAQASGGTDGELALDPPVVHRRTEGEVALSIRTVPGDERAGPDQTRAPTPTTESRPLVAARHHADRSTQPALLQPVRPPERPEIDLRLCSCVELLAHAAALSLLAQVRP